MITIKKIKYEILGVDEIEQNRLPKLREVPFDKDLIDGGLLKTEQEGFRYMTGDRHLPYRIQDSYHRNKKNIVLDGIEIENEILKAVILPAYGGRIWSLYNKVEEKEILFCNPVFQPGNLAVRNAWVSGGIEWNLGQFGHSSLTMDHLYAAICKDDTGREFVRLYEYERIKGLFLNVDLHLLPNDDSLYAHVTITNSHDDPRSLYWWTNIAVELNRNCRVISGTDQVIATTPVNGENTFGHDQLPNLKSKPSEDASFPAVFDYSNEYFFQNNKDIYDTWEMALYNDGTAFYERSTKELPYRKMFCWSNEQGGNHWQHFLATDDAPLYVELQGGLVSTQVHGDMIAPHSSISFTQAFGGMRIDVEKAHKTSYLDCVNYCREVVEEQLPSEQLTLNHNLFESLSSAPIAEIIHSGSGYALLEEMRKPGFIPSGMTFTSTNGDESDVWSSLLTEYKVPELVDGYGISYLTDSVWIPYLEKAVEAHGGVANFYYGIALFENGFTKEAIQALTTYAEQSNELIGYRTLGYLYARLGDSHLAQMWYDKAFTTPNRLHPDYYEEYLRYLVNESCFKKAWDLYCSASSVVQGNDNVKLRVLGAAVECKAFDFAESMFAIEQINIREGEVVLNKHWLRMKELQFIDSGMSHEEAKEKTATLTIPYMVDFRLNET